jgi:hypothetical protein
MRDDLWFEVVSVLARAFGILIGTNFGLFILPIILHSCLGVAYID